jgi:hypothetical protein
VILAESKDSPESANNLNDMLLHTEHFGRKSKAMAMIGRDTVLVNIMINAEISISGNSKDLSGWVGADRSRMM